jgi:glycosyltransferase involved in cell wall biosynthesis
MNDPEIALLMSTYQRPRHLRMALESIALQCGVEGKMELVISDDGSTDETPEIVRDFARRVSFPVGFTTHPHTTFALARCRNEGARASRAAYLLFLDGDCILPRDHVQVHLERRKPGVVMAGDFCRMDEASSSRVTAEVVRSGEFAAWAPKNELARLRKLDRASRFYRLIRHPTKPKLVGNNVGIWRSDFERVNGYDENFQGWGCEDDDLRHRLRRSGVRIESILRWTHNYHLWHTIDVTQSAVWKQGANVEYFFRKGRLTRCRNGLEKRRLDDIAIRVVGSGSTAQGGSRFVEDSFRSRESARPEVEILFLPGAGRFSGRADCNILVALDARAAHSSHARQAHVTIAPRTAADFDRTVPFPLDEVDRALGAVA